MAEVCLQGTADGNAREAHAGSTHMRITPWPGLKAEERSYLRRAWFYVY